MAGLQVIAGSKLFIGSRVAYKTKVTAADFTGQVWTEIGPLTTLGDLGRGEFTMASQEVINQRTTQYRKGVLGFPMMENAVLNDGSDAGQIAFALAADGCDPFAFMVQRATDCERSSIVTMTVASPGVITWTNHGLLAGTPISFATTGALPTGLVAGTTYYVVPTIAANTFSVAATIGGAAIVTSGAQSGVHTATAQPVGETDMFFGLPMPSTKTGGGASDAQTRAISIQPITAAITV